MPSLKHTLIERNIRASMIGKQYSHMLRILGEQEKARESFTKKALAEMRLKPFDWARVEISSPQSAHLESAFLRVY